MVCDLNVDVASQPLDPATHLPLMKVQYSDNILEDKFQKAGNLNFFNPEVEMIGGRESLAISQSIRIRFKEYRNPFNNVGISEVVYKDGLSCPPVMDDQCDPGCISTENKWSQKDVKFKNKFRVGVSWCVESEKLLYQDGESRFNESVSDSETVTATVGWSELICQAIDNAADKLLPTFTLSPTHYFDAGNADRIETLTPIINYFQRVYGTRWASEFAIVADAQFEVDVLKGSSTLHNYGDTGQPTPWVHTDSFVAGGFRPMTALPRGLWGKPVMIAPDVVDYYPTDGALVGQNLNPFSNANGTKYYVVIASKRSFYHGAVSLMDKRYFPATCDNKYDSIQQTWISFYDLLFPKEVFVVAFNRA